MLELHPPASVELPQLLLCGTEISLPAEPCSPCRFSSNINDCYYLKLLSFEVILCIAIDIQDKEHLLFLLFSVLRQCQDYAIVSWQSLSGRVLLEFPKRMMCLELVSWCPPSSFPRQMP